MFAQRLYYALKPHLPWTWRMALRRTLAKAKRKSCAKIWPIKESAGRTPLGWPGWPDGKKFAVVLTHDVEGPEGLAKCRDLAKLDAQFGFCASFNLIPEGPYAVPPALRTELAAAGFEVGVHDLRHDGRLFGSHANFKLNAKRINHYLREWDASGFRSGFMLRNLGWLQRLDIAYDLSTFDTDPFEMQPSGVDTIFPFWNPVPAGSAITRGPFPGADGSTAFDRGGYVELPYTLPQDSTLFLVLGETSPDIWIKKLDWIAAHGGMALVNVHPDYINFSSGPDKKTEYAAGRYAALLQHIAEKHAGTFWNPLPKQMAHWYNSARPIHPSPDATPAPTLGGDSSDQGLWSGLRGKQVAVLLYSDYPSDPRPRRAAEALAQMGADVEVICLRQDDEELAREIVNGVSVRRLPMKHRRGGKLAYLWQYASFLFNTFFILGWRALRKRYDMVHVHNMPDVLVFSALMPKLRGAKIILDLHDPMPELMMTIFGSPANGAGIKLLKMLEKLSIGFADAVLTVNETCKKMFAARSCRTEKVSVVMNAPDEEIFQYRKFSDEQAKVRDRVVFMYHGSLVERHGLDLAVAALAKVRVTIPGAELRVYGKRTKYLDKVLDDLKGTPVETAVHYLGPKNLEEIVKAIAECDAGIIPNRRSIFTEINTPTRIFEYLSQAKPVIAPRSPGILDYFGPDDLLYFELGDIDELAAKMEEVFHEPAAVAASVVRGQRIYQNHTWARERTHLLNVFASVLGVAGRSETKPAAHRGVE